MLKRLLVAVFVLGLLLAFSSTAISGPIGNDETIRKAVPTGTTLKGVLDNSTSHPLINARIPSRKAVSDFYPAPAGVDTTGCGEVDFTDYANTSGYYAWDMAGNDPTEYAMRYDPAALGYNAQVIGARVRVYYKTGAATFNVRVYDDNAGIPGTLLYSETFTATTGFNLYTFTTPVNVGYSTGYHISMGGTGTAADTVTVGTDDGLVGTGRGSINIGGTWYPNTAIDFGGGVGYYDFNWRVISAVCQTGYTLCAMIIPDPRGYYADFLPDNLWSDASVLSGTGQKFKAEGPETLTSIRFRHTTGGAYGDTTTYLDAGTNGLTIKIWGDSSGFARLTPGPILSFGYPGGKANMFPHTGNLGGVEYLDIPVPGTPVMLGFYHITVELTSLSAADGTIGFRFGQPGGPGGGMVKFTPPGSGREWDNIAGNANMATEFYGTQYDGTHSCDIRPTTCKSEFIECKYGTATSCGILTRIQQASMVPPAGCAVSQYRSWAQRIKGNPVNMIDKVRVMVVADYNSGTCLSTPTATLQICVWQSVGGAPGPLIAAYPVTPIVSDPGWNEVVIPGGLQILGDFFIGYNIDLFTTDEFIWAGFQRNGDAGVCPPIRGGAWVQTKLTGTPPDVWWNRLAQFAVEDNLVAEVDFCAIPLDERPCVTENDWPTLQHDFQRTGASGVALEDAYCDLTLNWSRNKPSGNGTNYNGPIIWNDYVICAFSASTVGSYEVFNLQTGATVYSFTDLLWGNDQSVIAGNIRCTPTVATVDVDGTVGVNLKPVLFLTSGNPGSISAFDLSAGFPPTKLWTYNDGGIMGAARYGNIIVLNQGGTDVVYVAADDNKVYAINAATGLPYAGWAAPYALGLSSQKSGATDGTNLFYSLYNSAGNGKITAIKASNGTMAWDFTGLQGAVIHAADGVTIESFEAGVSVDPINTELFANSREFNGGVKGIFYRLNTQTGVLLSAADADRARLVSPTIDAKRIYVPSMPAYIFSAMPHGGNVLAFSRLDGTLDYATTSFGSLMTANTQVGCRAEGLLTCEPDSSDLLFVFNTSGYLSCFKADNGDEIFNRRIDHGGQASFSGGSGGSVPAPSEGGMGAIGRDALGNAHLVYVDAYGSVYDMTKQSPRSRLELLAGSGVIAVPFGSPADTVVEFPDMYTNTGCVDLVVSLKASTTTNGTTNPAPGMNLGTIGSRLDQTSSSLADALSGDAKKLMFIGGKKYLSTDMFGGSTDEVVSFVDVRETYNRSAAAVPAFLIQNPGGWVVGDVFDPAGGGFILAPGAIAGIRVHANGPLVNRGPNNFYCEFTLINDPDYYIDNTARRPEVKLSLVGGCLLDTTTLHFGASGANTRLVANTSLFAHPDWVPYGVEIDGYVDISFAGTVIYGVTQKRVAFSANAWNGSTNMWISSQADPSYCDVTSCKPNITYTELLLGSSSSDGLIYTPIKGSIVCKSMIDSVQNMALPLGPWSWAKYGNAPFDNDSTMGLAVNARVMGVEDAAPEVVLLNNMTLDIWDVKERNNRAVPNWKIGVYNDNDMRIGFGGTYDTTFLDRKHSVGWSASNTAGDGGVAGFAKIPFGCGYQPMKNAVCVVADEWVYIPTWDTAYYYMNKDTILYDQGVATSPQDEGSFYTFAEHDFTPGETYSFGYAFFAFVGLDSAFSSTYDHKIADVAVLVNKWAGFGRGDINNDGAINLTDIIRLFENVAYDRPGPIPFLHLGDVDASGGDPNLADVQYLLDYYFNYGPCPLGAWVL